MLITTQSVKDEPDTGMAKKEPPKLDLDITQCKILPPPSMHLEDNHDMKDMLAKVSIPANLAENEAGLLVEQITQVKKDLRARDEELKLLASTINQSKE